MLVHELARELGCSSRDLIAELRAQGEWVSSHRATVPEPVVRRYLPDGPRQPRDQPREYFLPVVAGPYLRRPAWRRRPGPQQVTMRRPPRDEYDDPIDHLRFEPLITTRDVADLYRVTLATVRQWVVRGYITPVGKHGPSNLFDTGEVDRAVATIRARRKGTGVRRQFDQFHVGLTPADRIMPKHYDLVVTPGQAAHLVGVSPSTIRSWLHRGHITRLPSSAPSAVELRLGDVVTAARERQLPRPAPRKSPPL